MWEKEELNDDICLSIQKFSQGQSLDFLPVQKLVLMMSLICSSFSERHDKCPRPALQHLQVADAAA